MSEVIIGHNYPIRVDFGGGRDLAAFTEDGRYFKYDPNPILRKGAMRTITCSVYGTGQVIEDGQRYKVRFDHGVVEYEGLRPVGALVDTVTEEGVLTASELDPEYRGPIWVRLKIVVHDPVEKEYPFQTVLPETEDTFWITADTKVKL